ncbi:MAG: hypothetical protein KDC98_03065 [Planctomycetes bacterium]|nr:hypothetical protein [Planctomycetota bacterium]
MVDSSGPANETAPAGSPTPAAPNLDDPEQLIAAVREVSLILMGNGLPRQSMSQLQKMLRENVGDFPWQEVTRRILTEPVDMQRIVQQALAAQRDWIWRGGRETPGPSAGHRAKGFVAKICAQTIFLAIWAIVIVVTLVVLKHGNPSIDIYGVLEWLYQTFPSLRR